MNTPNKSYLLMALLLALVFVHANQPNFVYETIIPGYYLSRGNDMIVDADGNAYVIASWYQDHQHLDILVIKLDADGTPVWMLPIVGDELEHDYATDITLDSDNNIWVTGWTSSESFPITPDAYQPDPTFASDAFLMKLDSEDGTILYSSYLGGDYSDRAYGITLNDADEIYIVGNTGSTDFPTTPDAYQGEPSAPLYIYSDAFITKFSADGSTILYSTYFGGFKDDWAYNVALDNEENIVFSGHTNADDFPLVNPIQSAPDGIFLSKLSADGTTLQFSTYFGGEDLDGLGGMTLDSNGFVYITGSTRSINFPTTPGAFQEDFVGEILGCEESFPPIRYNCDDAFVTKLGTDGSGLIYSTFLGGTIIDKGSDITVDNSGCAHVVGYTVSPNFLGSGNNFASIFITKLSASGSDLLYALTKQSYSANAGHGIAVDQENDAYFTGAVNAPADIYVAKITEGQTPNITVSIWSNMIQVPRNSNFIFNVYITNNETTTQTFKIWTAAQKLPTGPVYEPLLGPATISLNPGQTRTFRNIAQYVGNVPLGTYRYYVRVGENFPEPLWAEDYWDVTVVESGSKIDVKDTKTWGTGSLK